MPAQPLETRTYTRIQNPTRARYVRWLWLIVAVVIFAIYIIGFWDFFQILWRGMPIFDQANLVGHFEEVRFADVSEELANLGIEDSAILLAINENEAFLPDLRARLGENDSSRLINFPSQCLCFGNVGESVSVRYELNGEVLTVDLPLNVPNNLMVRSFTKLGFSMNAAAIFVLLIEMIYALFFLTMAALIFRNRSDDWMALLVASALLFLGLSTGIASHLDSVVINTTLFRFVIFFSGIPIYASAFFFPDGRAFPRWSLAFFLLYILQLPIAYAIDIPYRSPELAIFIRVSYISSVIALPLVLAYRYRRIFTREQKQQSKWMILGLLALIIGLIVVNTQRGLYNAGFGEEATIFFALSYSLEKILSLGLPISVAFAIMQHRLWEIDLVLNRSVVVLGVTIVLGAIFAAVFLFMQSLITFLIGSDGSAIAVTISAVVSGFAFNPARVLVQRFIDRRLFGLRFDLNQLNAAQIAPVQRGVLSGERVGDYVFGEIIGRGGMGEVYKGFEGEYPVAIKTLRPDVISDDLARERFLREGKIQLEHEKIANVLDVGEAKGIPYIVMDFIEGKTLKEHLQEGVLSVEMAVSIICDICDALQAAHEAGYVHRDIKPANIMLRPSKNGKYEAVITDFGVAKWRGSKTELTGTGAIGTIDYMSPEQIRTSRTVDGRADIYAMGVMLYEMLAGDRPFTGGLATILFAHLNQPPPDILKIRYDVPVTVAVAIIRAMAKDPSDRYDSAAKFAEAVKR